MLSGRTNRWMAVENTFWVASVKVLAIMGYLIYALIIVCGGSHQGPIGSGTGEIQEPGGQASSPVIKVKAVFSDGSPPWLMLHLRTKVLNWLGSPLVKRLTQERPFQELSIKSSLESYYSILCLCSLLVYWFHTTIPVYLLVLLLLHHHPSLFPFKTLVLMLFQIFSTPWCWLLLYLPLIRMFTLVPVFFTL